MELAVKDNQDGTFTLTVDGADYVESDGATVLVRESVQAVVADATILFGGHADTITTPDPPPPPPPPVVDSQGNINVEVFDPSAPTSDATPGSPAPPAPVVEPNPVPPAVAPVATDPATTPTPPQ